MSFNENLKNIRGVVGITQKSLGEIVGVTSVTIGNWERGTRQPSFDLLPKLADALDTSIDILLGRCSGENSDENEFLTKYRQLDKHGKKLVRLICDTEIERINSSSKNIFKHECNSSEKYNRYIPFYQSPSAAGISVPLEGDEFEMILADETVPPDADYAVCISGDSMEPYIQNGEMVFVKETQDLHVGDVGIFCVDGAMYCKQYYIDNERNLHLISANSKRAYSNVFVDSDSGTSVRCCGKVILNNKITLPDYFKY